MRQKIEALVLVALLVGFVAAGLKLEAQNTAPIPTTFAIAYGNTGNRAMKDSSGGYIWAWNIEGTALANCVYDTLSDGGPKTDSLLGGQNRRWFFEVTDTANVDATFRNITMVYGGWGRRTSNDTTLALHRDISNFMVFDFPYEGIHTVFDDADDISVGDQFMIALLREQFQ